MNRWAVYFKERFPPVPNLIVAGGIVLSARWLAPVGGSPEGSGLPILAAMVGGMLFLMQLRLMDELKDLDKDRIAHPERPLPRGLFTAEEFSRFISRCQWAMGIWALVLFGLRGPWAGGAFAIGVVYLHLMFKEFYLGDRLAAHPLLYAILHQVIIYPLGAFVLACFDPQPSAVTVFLFCTLLLGAFFGFEVGRKLDPRAHPVLKTYLGVYGPAKTAFLMLTVLGIATHAGRLLGVGSILGPLYILVLGSVSLLWWAPSRFKWIEGFVTLYLLVSLWAIPLKRGWLGGSP